MTKEECAQALKAKVEELNDILSEAEMLDLKIDMQVRTETRPARPGYHPAGEPLYLAARIYSEL